MAPLFWFSSRSQTFRPACCKQGHIISVEPVDHIHAALEQNITSHAAQCQSQGLQHSPPGVLPALEIWPGKLFGTSRKEGSSLHGLAGAECAPIKACRAGVGDGIRDKIDFTVYPNFTCAAHCLLTLYTYLSDASIVPESHQWIQRFSSPKFILCSFYSHACQSMSSPETSAPAQANAHAQPLVASHLIVGKARGPSQDGPVRPYRLDPQGAAYPLTSLHICALQVGAPCIPRARSSTRST